MLSTFDLRPRAKVIQLGDSTGAENVAPSPLPPIQCFYPTKARAELFYRVGGPMGSAASIAISPSMVRSPIAWVNVAINGWTLSNILAALPAQLTQYTPSHAVMHAGINDVQSGVPLVTSQADFTGILDAIAPRPFLVVLPYFWTALNTQVLAFNAAMTTIAQAYDNVCLLNAHDAMGAPASAAAYTLPDTDEAHYNGDGRSAFTSIVTPVVRFQL